MVEMSNLASNNSKRFLGDGILNDAVTNVAKSANSILNNAPKSNSIFGDVSKSANSAFNNLGKSANSALNNVGKSANSILNDVGKSTTNALNNVGKTANSALNNMGLSTFSNSSPNSSNAKNMFGPLTNNSNSKASIFSSEWAIPLGIFTFLVVLFIVLFNVFINEIKAGYENLSNALRSAFNMDASPPSPIIVTTPPPTTQVDISNPTSAQLQSQSIIESVLPLKGPPEVFNVSKNDFSYYDAEPLCRALGAELATYDQVKEAYGKGADWCNYGWTKGQVAIYPTQKATWDELQSGAEDERDACGKPGVNGGYFDNPEMKFGVNCYGAKPGQSAHDEAYLMKQGRLPSSASSLKTEEKVKQFEAQANNMGIMPFNKGKWQSQ